MVIKRSLLFGFLVLGGTITVLQGMDGNIAGSVTYGCDWCQEQKAILNRLGPDIAYHGVSCQHILCKECANQLSQQYPDQPHDQRFYWCKLCRAFYDQKYKVCWFATDSAFSSSATNLTAFIFKKQFGGTARQLPDVDTNTVIPANPDLKSESKCTLIKLPFKLKVFENKRLLGCMGLLVLCVIGYDIAYKKYCTAKDDNDEDQENNENETNRAEK